MIVSSCLGTPENVGVTEQLCPHLGPREGRGEVATFDIVPFVGQPRECSVYVADALLYALGKARVREPLVILSPLLAPPENARVM